MKNADKYFDLTIALSVIGIWLLMIGAKLSEYETNYGFFIYAILLSVVVTAVVVAYILMKGQIRRRSAIASVFFLITSSPSALLSFVWLYGELIGQYFKL